MITIKKFLEVISNFNIASRLIVSSFYPKLLLGLSFSNIKKRWFLTSISLRRNPAHFFYALTPIRTALSCKATGIGPNLPLINKNIINKAHKNNLMVAAWTINDEKEMKNLLRYDIDYLIIDPNLILKPIN
jgi:glycerophosphoryl diester phosphodiesterase